MKHLVKQPLDLSFLWRQSISKLRIAILFAFLFAPAIEAVGQSKVWISNPTKFHINYKLLFARSAQNFAISPGLRNEHSSREYPATFLVDLNVNLSGYPKVKRFRLEQNRSYYFRLSGNQLHLLKQPHNFHTRKPVPVTAKVQVYALGGHNPLYHSSIILYNTSDPYINGREWSFWPQGRAVVGNIGYIAGGRVANGKPAGVGRPIKSFNLKTQHNPQVAAAIFNDVKNRWSQRQYRALDSNCNHFVNDVMAALGAGRHPVQYQNSWGSRAPVTQVRSAFENNYGVPCGPSGRGGVYSPGSRNHNHNHPPNHAPQPYDIKSEIIRRVLRGIGL